MYYRFKKSAFFIEDQISSLPNDQSGRSTITNNRPLAVGNGAIFLTNSPFFTTLLFVKSPLVTSLISRQAGNMYFCQLLASMVRLALDRLDDQASLHSDLYALLPVAKMMSLRIMDLPDTFTVSHENSIIRRPSASMAITIQESLSQTDEEFRSKRQRLSGGNHLTDSLEATTPIFKEPPLRSLPLSPPPPFQSVSTNHVSWKSNPDDLVLTSSPSH